MKEITENRARMIDKIIQTSYDSLVSHLPYTHDVAPGDLIRDETIEFHKECIREYALIIYLASKLY